MVVMEPRVKQIPGLFFVVHTTADFRLFRGFGILWSSIFPEVVTFRHSAMFVAISSEG